jgi:aryl-alcohol dehydrogenase-like predicted oxidoreductase
MRPPLSSDRIALAGSEVGIPPMGVGTWAWGDKSTWGMGGYDSDLTMDSIRVAWDASIDAGVVLFDTAEVYGKGESERIIGKLLADDPERAGKVLIATKFMPSPWKLQVTSALLASLRASIDRLGVEAVDLYQIHGPISLRSHGAMADALAAAHSEGLLKAIGVSNYSAKETRAIDAALRERGVRLATNQIEYSLLRRKPEDDGLIDCCRELGVVPLAYSPIGQGRLTGKYSAANPPPGNRSFSNHPMEQVDRVVAELRRIGDAHDGRTPSQVALSWLIAKGAVPIPGAKNRRQAEENAGALGWAMDEGELAALDAVALHGKSSLQSRFWQHG